MGVNVIPPRPVMAKLDPADPDFANKQLEQNMTMNNYNLIVQQAFEDQKKEYEMASNAIAKQGQTDENTIGNMGR